MAPGLFLQCEKATIYTLEIAIYFNYHTNNNKTFTNTIIIAYISCHYYVLNVLFLKFCEQFLCARDSTQHLTEMQSWIMDPSSP